MFRKTVVTALIAFVSAGTLLAKVPLDAPDRRDHASPRHILAEQAGPKRVLRFKAPRAIVLRTGEIERMRQVATG